MSDSEALPIDRKVIFRLRGPIVHRARHYSMPRSFAVNSSRPGTGCFASMAAEHKADGQDLEFSDDAIDAAAERFRYEHDLITAEETEQWLAQRGLNLADFSAYFVRQYWGEQFDDVEPEPLDYLSAPNEMRELLTTELILSGELDRMAHG